MPERSKLSALLTGVMSAVQKAAVTAGQQNMHVLKHYFERDPHTQELRPITTRIQIGSGQVLEVPLICLLEPSGYVLDELQMDLSVRLQLDQVKKAVEDLEQSTIKKGSYSVELCPRDRQHDRRPTDVVDVRVKFKSSEPAEGLSRIIEDLNNTISPTRPKPTEPTEEQPLPDSAPIVLDDGQDLDPHDHTPETDSHTGLEDQDDQS